MNSKTNISFREECVKRDGGYGIIVRELVTRKFVKYIPISKEEYERKTGKKG